MDQIEQQRERELEDPDYAAEVKAFREQLEAETREQTIAAKEAYREMRRQQRLAGLAWLMMMKTMMKMTAKWKCFTYVSS